MIQYFVYILKCADGAYYVGSHRGDDVAVRVSEHNVGKHPNAYTFRRRPVELVWSDWFSSVEEAIAFERKVKGWSRAKKEAFMRGDFNALSRLAKRPTARN